MFTSDSQHPPRSRHGVHLGAMFNLSLECISPILFKQTFTTLIYLQFYDDGVMFMDSVPFGGKSSRHFANHQNDSNVSDFQNLKF